MLLGPWSAGCLSIAEARDTSPSAAVVGGTLEVNRPERAVGLSVVSLCETDVQV